MPKTLAKSVLIPPELTTAATDAGIQKKIFGYGDTQTYGFCLGTSTLTISNKKKEDIIKIVKIS